MFARTLTTLLLAASPILATPSPLGTVVPSLQDTFTKRQDRGVQPAIAADFPDPSIINVGGVWHAFATIGNGVNIQHSTSTDFKNWSPINQANVLPALPGWVTKVRPDVWAPDVKQLDDGTFIMYYTASVEGQPGLHCIGTATSRSVTGPYTPAAAPWECAEDGGGAIDASGFKDVDGKRYVTYKVDGNALEPNSCALPSSDVPPTPLLLQEVAANGVDKIGEPITLLNRDPIDGPVIEAPQLARLNGRYFLWFSSNCFNSDAYDVTFAVADSVRGPFRKTGPMFLTGDFALRAPGGAGVTDEGDHLVFHAGPVLSRFMYAATIKRDGEKVTACIDGKCKTVQ